MFVRPHASARSGSDRARSRTFGALATVVVVLALGACDPCAGVIACVVSPRLGVSGEIVDRGDPTRTASDPLSGAGIPEASGVAGVRVEVIPTASPAIDAGSATATTDARGFWSVDIPARDTGAVTADIVVTPPDGRGYRVRGVSLRASRTHGDGNVVGRWTRELYLSKLGEVIDSPSGDRLVGTRVSVVRRGGIELAPTRNTESTTLTVGGGRFLYDVRPLGDGPLVVDVIIERAGYPTATVRNVPLLPMYVWGPPNVDGAIIIRLDSAGNRVSQ